MKVVHALAAAAFSVSVAFSGAAFAVTQEEAVALAAAQDWRGAANAYDQLLREDRHNAAYWYGLGQARHQLGEFAAARRAYQNALANNHPAPGRVRFNLARVLMTMGRRDEALEVIQQLVGTGITYRMLLGAAEFEPLVNVPAFQAVVAAQTPCNTPPYHQFDFWLGEWDVSLWSGGPPIGQNSITAQHEGCVVQEQYTAGGFTGMSMNFYDSARQVWHQTWMSNQGGMLYLEGGINADGAMEMSDRNLPSSVAANGVINRTIWTPLPEGGLRQLWERSTDNGATWTTVFDGRYVRRNPG